MKLTVAAATLFQLISIASIPVDAKKGIRRRAKAAKGASKLKAVISTYPGSVSLIQPTGSVKVKFKKDDSFKFSFDLEDLEADCVDCGIHIHSGTTCDDADLVGGHYWDAALTEDLWTVAGGAVYNSDSSKKAKGSYNLYNGYGYEGNVNHAVTVHASDGVRIGCGVLE